MANDLGDALEAICAAEPGYGKAVAYSDGPVTEVFASRRIRRLLRDKGISFQTLLGWVVIDAVADKLKITAISSDTDERTALLAAVDEVNNMALVRPQVMRRALQLGDSYLWAWPELDDKGNPVPGSVRISWHDARNMRVLYDEDQPGVPRLAIQRWAVTTDEGKRVRVDLIYPDRIDHFISKGTRASKPSDFQPYSEEGMDSTEENPYGFPVFHFHGTGLPGEYGTPEHASFYGCQDKLIKLTSVHMAGLDFHGIPQRVALEDGTGNAAADASNLDEDEFAVSPDGQRTDTVHGGDATSKLSSEPGSVWFLKNVKQFLQLEPAPPGVFLDPRQAYLREGAVASKTPLHLFDRSGQLPSGESLKTANEPLDTKSDSRKTSFDGTWRAFYRFVLKLLGQADAPVSIAWAPIESTDETTKLGHAKQKQELGVPVDQSLTEVGYKSTDVERWMQDGEGGLPARVELLQGLGAAVRDLSTAVASGILDKATVDAVITKLIGDVSDAGAA
ncbi:hypothetical protein [Amycolatopsis sp. NPDC004625]|uniref:hypothetical protein n=1 Tax=Amycolatopsis sp. NPDC004625 TaxID=3154670 RepID=UPI0033A6BB57